MRRYSLRKRKRLIAQKRMRLCSVMNGRKVRFIKGRQTYIVVDIQPPGVTIARVRDGKRFFVSREKSRVAFVYVS